MSTYDKNEKGKVVCLAYVENGNIKINQEVIQIFRKHKDNIAFVGNLGQKGSGKSFWYDKILNLT